MIKLASGLLRLASKAAQLFNPVFCSGASHANNICPTVFASMCDSNRLRKVLESNMASVFSTTGNLSISCNAAYSSQLA